MENLETKTIKVIAYDNNPIGYAIVDDDNTIPCDKIVPYKGREVVHLPSNSTLRVWIDRAKLDAAIADHGYLELDYKARTQQGVSTKMFKVPGAMLLSEEEQAELTSIVTAARERMQADKKKPLTELEKLQARLDKLNAKIEAARAATVADNTDTSSNID